MTFLDGALGSILLHRANKSSTGLWSAQFLLNDPAAITKLYEEYVSIGSDLITTNTYSTIPSYLDKENAKLVIDLILSSSKKFNLSTIIASHDISFRSLFDKSYTIEDKSIKEC